MIKKTVFTRN